METTTIKEGTKFTIMYLCNGATQTKRIVTSAEIEIVHANKATWKALDIKEKVKFEKNNKCRLEFGEVYSESALGLAVMGKTANEVCFMELPAHQGGIHQLIILDIL